MIIHRFPCSIEALEDRIAPATLTTVGTGSVLTFTDIDGDLVKVTFAKAVLEPGDFTFSNGSVNGDQTTPQQLVSVDLQTHNGASLTMVATPQKVGGIQQGDSHANVKTINATGTNLGAVKVDGDVQAITAVEVKSFSALSFGSGYDDGGLNISQLSTVGTFAVKGDIAGHVALTVTGDVKSFTVGGSIGTVDAYRLQFNGKVGTVKVGGSIIGQATNKSLVVDGAVGTFSVGGSIIGSNSDLSSGTQILLGQVKTITIGGDLFGKAGKGGASIAVGSGAVGAIKIGGSMLGGAGVSTGSLSLNASAASITVGGNLQGGDGSGSAAIFAKSVGTIKIGGSISGTSVGQTGGIVSVDDVGSLTVGHDIVSRFNSGFLLLRGKVGSLKIGGDIRCEDTTNPSSVSVISVAGVLGSLSVGGSIIGEEDHVARIVVGGAGAAPGTAALKSMTVKHSVIRAAIASGFSSEAGADTARNGQAGLGSITIGGDLSGSYIVSGGTASGDGLIGTLDDGLVAGGKAGIASLKIAGALTGLVNDAAQYQVYSRNIQKVTIGKATYTYAQLVADSPNFDAIGHAAIICPS